MKTRILLGVLVVLIVASGWTFVKRPLTVPDTPGVPLPPGPGVQVSVSVVSTAEIASLHAFSVRGGSFTNGFTSAIAAFLVEHPRGKVLIDAGAARDIDAHMETIPWLMRAVSSLTLHQPTVDALKAGGLDPSRLSAVWLTHSH